MFARRLTKVFLALVVVVCFCAFQARYASSVPMTEMGITQIQPDTPVNAPVDREIGETEVTSEESEDGSTAKVKQEAKADQAGEDEGEVEGGPSQDTPAEDEPEKQPAPEAPAEPDAVEKENGDAAQPSAEEKSETKEDAKIEEDAEAEEELDTSSLIKLHHSTFNKKCEHIFSTYVDKYGLVNYKKLRSNRIVLIQAARELDNIHPAELMSLSREEKIAFWINAHNIFTLKLVIDNYHIKPPWYLKIYPKNSIMRIPGGREKTYFKVMGLEYHLPEIEKELLLDKFNDPRICFALSYACKSGPFLRNEPYSAGKLNEQLDDQVKRFLADERGIKIVPDQKIVYLAALHRSHKDTFVNSKYGKIKKFRQRKPYVRAFLNFIMGYLPPEDAKFIESQGYIIRTQIFDWHLDEQAVNKAKSSRTTPK